MEKETGQQKETIEQGDVPKGVKLALYGVFVFMLVIGFVAWKLYD